MKTLAPVLASLFLFTACGTEGTDGDSEPDNNEEIEDEPDPNLDTDEDGITDLEEEELGTNPELADSDEDGIDDIDEIACGSSPTDSEDKCYACGWKQNDPGNLVSDGANVGDVVDDASFPDQCGDWVRLWDFYGEYHILYMTAAW
jgi:hypothetical protein